MKNLGEFLGRLKTSDDLMHPINSFISQKKRGNFEELLDQFPEFLNKEDKNGYTPLVFSLAKYEDGKFKSILLKIIENDVNVDYNAKTKDNLCLLGHVMNRKNASLLKFFLINTRGKINPSINVFDDNVYYASVHLRGITRQRKLDFINVFLQFKFTLPTDTNNAPTVSQYCIRFYRTMIHSATLLYKVKYIKLLKEIFGRLSKVSLTYMLKCSRRENIIHHCIYYNTPILLAYILEILSVDKSLLKTALEAKSAHDYSLLKLASLPALHQERFSFPPRQESRIACLKAIMKYTTIDFNEATVNNRFTALHFTLSGNFYHLDKQAELSLFLIDNGADLYFLQNPRKSQTPLYWVYACLQDKVLKGLLERGLIDVNLTFDETKVKAVNKILISCLYDIKYNRLDSRDSNYTAQLERAKEMSILLFKYNGRISTYILQNIIMFLDNTYGRNIINFLLVNKNYFEDIDHYPLSRYITISTMCQSKIIFNILLKHEIFFSTPMNINVCRNTPPHRTYTFDNTVDKYKYFKKSKPTANTCIGCDLCGIAIPTFGNNPVTSCSVRSCDIDLCSTCAYFSVKQRSRGINAYELADRARDVYFMNLLSYLERIRPYKSIHKHSGFKDNIEAFRNAKIDNAMLLKKFAWEEEERIGVFLEV